MTIDSYINREMFLVVRTHEVNATEIDFIKNIDALNAELEEMTPGMEEVDVYHGILTPAEYLPLSFKGKTAFIVSTDPNDPSNGDITESSFASPQGLAGEISSIINGESGAEEHAFSSIHDMYVLYGYQLRLCLAVGDGVLDEEIIDTCKKISTEVETVGRAYRESNSNNNGG